MVHGFGGCAVHGLEARATLDAPLFENGDEAGGELGEERVGEFESPDELDERGGGGGGGAV